ncbi:MAG: hypothetical protein ACYS8W_06720 [Planctomycetota bacterium]
MKNLIGPALVVLACILAVVVVVVIKESAFPNKPVVFSNEGIPHCPYCYVIVKPNTDYCYFCEKTFAWSDGISRCWDCWGSGERRKVEWDFAPTRRPGEVKREPVEGLCTTCEGDGYIWHIAHPVKNWDTRFEISSTEAPQQQQTRRPRGERGRSRSRESSQ